ncbi:cyclophilin-like fold protein [Enterococcus sp. AZ020]
MMNKIGVKMMFSFSLLLLFGCKNVLRNDPSFSEEHLDTSMVKNYPTESEEEKIAITKVTIDQIDFYIEWCDNASAKTLQRMFPLEIMMDDLHNNEKYYYLPKTLPTEAQSPGQISKGDVMLFGKDCLVLFYEDLETNYVYTRLGKIIDPEGLDQISHQKKLNVLFTSEKIE